MNNLSKAAALVGAAESNEIGYPDEPRTSLQLHIEAIKNASDYTGIPISDIDGVFSTAWTSDLGEHLGLHPKYIDTTAVGGCSFQIHVHHALCVRFTRVLLILHWLVMVKMAGRKDGLEKKEDPLTQLTEMRRRCRWSRPMGLWGLLPTTRMQWLGITMNLVRRQKISLMLRL